MQIRWHSYTISTVRLASTNSKNRYIAIVTKRNKPKKKHNKKNKKKYWNLDRYMNILNYAFFM